ncbi:hypothetical protein FQN54_003702 [Arachnomyces sp. PD_36]|nr:hypothetical protein FQN54_003702 [Arachnomyces sp. PD_36]
MAPEKPSLHPLQTPKSASFPSELQKSPHTATPDAIKQEDGLRTPITPPTAYTDFLKAITPSLTSPLSAGEKFASFRKESLGKSAQPSPLSSSTTCQFPKPDRHKSLSAPATSSSTLSPVRSAPLRSAPLRSARTPTSALRRLRIPPSPSYSPISESPRSAMTLRSPYSAIEWYKDGKAKHLDGPKSAQPVSVRQVVTRTVTYKRTPLEPAPKGKRKRVSE